MTGILKRRILGTVLIIVGVAACYTGISTGQADDAPGAGILGIATLAGAIAAAWNIGKERKEKGR